MYDYNTNQSPQYSQFTAGAQKKANRTQTQHTQSTKALLWLRIQKLDFNDHYCIIAWQCIHLLLFPIILFQEQYRKIHARYTVVPGQVGINIVYPVYH